MPDYWCVSKQKLGSEVNYLGPSICTCVFRNSLLPLLNSVLVGLLSQFLPCENLVGIFLFFFPPSWREKSLIHGRSNDMCGRTWDKKHKLIHGRSNALVLPVQSYPCIRLETWWKKIILKFNTIHKLKIGSFMIFSVSFFVSYDRVGQFYKSCLFEIGLTQIDILEIEVF